MADFYKGMRKSEHRGTMNGYDTLLLSFHIIFGKKKNIELPLTELKVLKVYKHLIHDTQPNQMQHRI